MYGEIAFLPAGFTVIVTFAVVAAGVALTCTELALSPAEFTADHRKNRLCH